jgi:hypothetical protein
MIMLNKRRWHYFFSENGMPSTVIKSFQYDEPGAVLTIEFVSGTRYAYYEVPKAVFEQFGKYREKGVFYNQEIKGKFRFARLEK